jgi:hypothetical protein
MLLVLTCSFDVTTDMVLDRLKDVPVFRFNIDLWNEHKWAVDDKNYVLSDPTGRQCSEKDVRAVYLRKLLFDPPFIDIPAGGSEESWSRQQLEALWMGIRDLAWHSGRLALVQPCVTGNWSKLRQMRVASKFFPVPSWVAHHNSGYRLAEPVVAKTFVPCPVGGGAILPVVDADQSKLSSDFPWFLQSKVCDASHDVTVVWVRGRCFAYELDRSLFDGPDCRMPTHVDDLQWPVCELTRKEEAAVTGFCGQKTAPFGF